MDEAGFRAWLLARGVRPTSAGTRIANLKVIEKRLGGLGVPSPDLDAAHAADALVSTIAAVRGLLTDYRNKGEAYRLLMPQSENPRNRLANLPTWVRQYGEFRSGGPAQNTPTLNEDALAVLKSRFLAAFPDFESSGGFSGRGAYHPEEDDYKRDMISRLAEAMDQTPAVSDGDLGALILERLLRTNLLGHFSTAERFKAAREANPDSFVAAIGALARAQDPPPEAAEAFLVKAWPMIGPGADAASQPYGDARILATVVQALARPEEAISVISRRFDNLSSALLGRPLFANTLMTAAEYARVIELSRELFQIMDEEWGWAPRDLWDVQGFVWVTCKEKLDVSDLKDADRIRTYALEHYVQPARSRGEATVSIRAGDIHNALGLTNAHANVCQALRGRLFRELAGVSDPTVAGPENSSTTTFTFVLAPASAQKPSGAAISQVGPTNLILYGPPGTGKTFATAREAVKLCSPGVNPDDRAAVEAEYGRLVEARQVEFVTFHQSYSYEDFVEGLRPPVSSKDGEGDEEKSGFRLEVSRGVFHRIASRAAASKGSTGKSFDLTGRQVFKMSIGEAANPEDAYLFEEALAEGYTLLGYGEIDWSGERFASRDEIIAAWHEAEPDEPAPSALAGKVQLHHRFRNELRIGDLLIVSKGNGQFRAIGEVTGPYGYAPRPEGDYAHRRAVKWLWSNRDGLPVEEILSKRFSQMSIYRLAIADLNVAALERLLTSQEPDAPPEPFVLIIDEINRANISKVFGELITLLEPDKRITPEGGGLRVRLPHSREAFGVPANLHIIGTMNTADRSIALLDTALRRRFEFRELMPDPDLPELKAAGARCGVDLGKLLRTLNDRIEYLFDREHQIGHAYFIKCTSRSDLDAVMRHKVIPLLAEYFYEDWSKVALVLGDADTGKPGRFLDRAELKPPGGPDFEGGETRWRWTVRSEFAADAYADFQ